MLATEILTIDHRRALSLIEDLEGAADGTGSYAEIFNQLETALELHIREEEEIYYPALAQYAEFEDLLEENVPEHEMVRQQLTQMGELVPSSPEFQKVLAEMKSALETHMTKEEEEIFPASVEVLGADAIESLGTEIEMMRNEIGMSQTG